MILIEFISPVARLLANAARNRGTVPFSNFHTVFVTPPGGAAIPDVDKYDTLEAACEALCHSTDAIYSALLSKKATGCPGDGFYDIFKNMKSADYIRLVGNKSTLALSVVELKAIADEERQNVYTDAQTGKFN